MGNISKCKLFKNYKYNLSDKENHENKKHPKFSLEFNNFNIILSIDDDNDKSIVPFGTPFSKQRIGKPKGGGLEPPNNGGNKVNNTMLNKIDSLLISI